MFSANGGCHWSVSVDYRHLGYKSKVSSCCVTQMYYERVVELLSVLCLGKLHRVDFNKFPEHMHIHVCTVPGKDTYKIHLNSNHIILVLNPIQFNNNGRLSREL